MGALPPAPGRGVAQHEADLASLARPELGLDVRGAARLPAVRDRVARPALLDGDRPVPAAVGPEERLALRVEAGYTYGASSYFESHKSPGPFEILSFTKNETTVPAIDLALQVLKKLHENGVTPEQLASAKSYIKGQYPPTIETSSQLVRRIVVDEFYGLGDDEVPDARRIVGDALHQPASLELAEQPEFAELVAPHTSEMRARRSSVSGSSACSASESRMWSGR